MLHQVAQHVEDRDRAVAFYRDVLRLPLLGTFPGLALLDLGSGTRVIFEGSGSSTLLYLGVDDIAAERARLESAGVAFDDEIHLIHTHDGGLGQPAGTEEWMTFFRDSEGNQLALSERRPAAARGSA
jgi:methylmalonyl-CoA/ethylmalonyl-CoA epimerase